MIGEDLTITGVIDFSPMTVAGDPMMDAAGAVLFLEPQTYFRPDDVRFLTRLLMERHGKAFLETLALYRLYYSLYFSSCSLDDPTLYRWCVDNLRASGETQMSDHTEHGVSETADEGAPVRLRPVSEVAPLANEIVAEVATELHALLPDCDVEHIGATALPDGVSKGDLDVNIRVPASSFERAVEMLTAQFAVAQRQNWTPTYASFSDPDRALPLGLQLTVIGSLDDFLVLLRDLMRSDPALRHDYERCKTQAAPLGRKGYWAAKNRTLQDLLRRHGVNLANEGRRE